MRRIIIALSLSALLVSFAFPADQKKDPEAIGSRKVDGGINFYSIEKEIALGKQLAIEVQRQAKILDDPITGEYINRLTQNLARNSDVKFPVTIKIIEDDTVNAFTLPGGFLFINTGLIRLSESESELASVLSHELGHVAARHYARQVSRGQLINGATVPLIFLGGPIGLATRQIASAAVPIGMFKFSRDFETEADMLGIEYLYKSGYDPSSAIDMFERIEAAEAKRPGAVSQLFQTHPPTADRIAKTQKNIQVILPDRPEYVVNTSEYEDVRAHLIGLLQAQQVKSPSAPALLKTPESDKPTLKRPQ
jgi:predicted Zn-dependent protease